MGLVRLLQISDLHLGRPFGWLPPDRREIRRKIQREALTRAIQEAIERDVQGILLAGDLFDEEGVDADSLAFAISAFEMPGCPRVFVAPGNHDPWSPTSLFWNPRFLKARGRAWPSHVHVFGDSHWTAVPLSEGVRVWGRCYVSKVGVGERPLSAEWVRDVKQADASGVEIAVFHGSREGQLPAGQTTLAPFSDDEAMESPFTYLAVGHYHLAGRLASPQGRVAGVRLAYAGSAVALDATEVGAHGALEVRIEHGHRQPFVETEFVPLDACRVHDVSIDVTGCTSAERVDRKIERALDEVSAGEDDVVTLRLTGRLARDVRYEPARELAGRVFHLRIDRRGLRPDYPLDRYRESAGTTTEERFAHALLQRLDATHDPEEKARIERALYHGLDAFQLREAIPVHEELEA